MEIDYIEQGDCMKLMKLLPDNSIDVVFTSPPYNRIRNDTYEDYDDVSPDYLQMLQTVTDECLRIVKDKVIINIQQNYFNKKEVFKYIGMYADKIACVVVWTKTNPQPSNNYNKEENTRSVTNAFEYFFILNENGKKFRVYGEENTLNCISTSVNSKHFKGHGAVMKKEVADWFIKKFTKEHDIVLDPFLGTGTTAVCCVEQDRHYIGFELSEKYFDIACKRLDDTEEKILKPKQMSLFDEVI